MKCYFYISCHALRASGIYEFPNMLVQTSVNVNLNLIVDVKVKKPKKIRKMNFQFSLEYHQFLFKIKTIFSRIIMDETSF